MVGSPRSGTTLMRNLLRSHPNLTIPHESHFIPLFHAAYGDPRTETEAFRLARAITRLRFVRAWRCTFDFDKLAACRSYADTVDTLFQAYARQENKPRWGDKTPQYVRHLPLLKRLFPNAQFIHMIRDGRDVGNSWLQTPFGPENWYAAARGWQSLVKAGRADGEKLGAKAYNEIRYEDLLADPEAVMRRVCAFLNEPWDEAVLAQTVVSATRYQSRLQSFRPRNPGLNNQPLPIARDNSGKWQSRMSPDDRAVFESVAGETLREFGYETEGLERKLGGGEILWWKLHSRVMEKLVKLNWYPTTAAAATAWEMQKATILAWWRGRR